MFKTRFIVFNLKKYLITLLILLFTVFLIAFSEENLISAKMGLSLWINYIVPSLLPFFIATELLSYTNISLILGKLLNKIMRPLFNVPGEGAYALVMGAITGYPVGAKIISKFKEQGICNNIECERLLAFTNNSGPLFIIGTIGITMFSNVSIGYMLFTTHLLACITVGIIFRWWGKNDYKNCNKYITRTILNIETQKKPVTFSNLGEVIANSIMSAINTILLIGGFVVLFSVIITIMENSKILILLSNILHPLFNSIGFSDTYSTGFICGLFEITNGISTISSVCEINTSMLLLTAFLLGFGGISVLLQVFSITSTNKISIKPYFIGKLLQGCFASLYTYLFIILQ